jgi:hypothetical protein
MASASNGKAGRNVSRNGEELTGENRSCWRRNDSNGNIESVSSA